MFYRWQSAMLHQPRQRGQLLQANMDGKRTEIRKEIRQKAFFLLIVLIVNNFFVLAIEH